MDVQMPELDGLEATRQIRERSAPTGAPDHRHDCERDGGDREECLAAGMDDYLSKPIRPEELARRFNRARPRRRRRSTQVRTTPTSG